MTRSIHEATLYSVQLLLALTPLLLLLSTLFALAIGVYTVSSLNLVSNDEEQHELKSADRLRRARDFAELSAIFGVTHEEHVVTTPDGYLLMLHRILPKEYRGNLKRPVVLLQHGLCTNSEFFMVTTNANRCLPLVLLEKGYDVWLGNNRFAATLFNHAMCT